jgi:hypothetical protein
MIQEILPLRYILMKVFDECVTGEENSQNEKLREELRS